MIEEMLIPGRFCGPPHSGNGGYTAGALAEALVSANVSPEAEDPAGVTVRLHQPPPLDAPMHLHREGDAATLTFGGALVASARLSSADVDPVEPVSPGLAQEASSCYAGFGDHPFPTCFSCGTDREDGLRIFPGRLETDATMVAAPWRPRPDLAAEPGAGVADSVPRTSTAVAWAALDCVGGWAGGIRADRPMVLGTMTARLETLPVVGEPHVVVGQGRGSEGRKTMTASTLYDADGRVVARAEHVWIIVDVTAFGGMTGIEA